MRLEIESVDIKDIQENSKACVKEQVLYINPKELEELILKDSRIKSVDINVVKPGDCTGCLSCVEACPEGAIREYHKDTNHYLPL